jgi:hypothetical protein
MTATPNLFTNTQRSMSSQETVSGQQAPAISSSNSNHMQREIDALPGHREASSSHEGRHSYSGSDCGDGDDVCYICLDGPREHEPLLRPCTCPRVCHAACLAKWQLNCAGKE